MYLRWISLGLVGNTNARVFLALASLNISAIFAGVFQRLLCVISGSRKSAAKERSSCPLRTAYLLVNDAVSLSVGSLGV